MERSSLPTTFRDHRQVLFALANDLRILEGVAKRMSLSDAAQECVTLRERVEKRKFTVAVLGEFKRGKSTFINALLGEEVLPADIAPTTATVNRVVYGLKKTATLHFHDGRASEDVPVTELKSRVTKLDSDAAASAAEIREAEIAWPLRFCRNDVDLLDTPGLADTKAMSVITRRILPEVDAALFVIMADSPFSESEGSFLQEMLSFDPGKVIFIVTALDRIRRDRDRERVLDYIRSKVQAGFEALCLARHPDDAEARAVLLKRLGQPQVFGVSGLQALDARRSGDRQALEQSGLEAFESHLESFLTRSDGLGLVRRLSAAGEIAARIADAPTPSMAVDDQTFDQRAALALLAALDQSLAAGMDDWRATARDHGGDAAALAEAVNRNAMVSVRTLLQRARVDALRSTREGDYEGWAYELSGHLWQEMIGVAIGVLQPATSELSEALAQETLLLSRLAMASQQVLKTITTLLEAHGRQSDTCHYSSELHQSLSALAAIRPDPSEGIAKLATGLLLSRDKIHALVMDEAVVEMLNSQDGTDLMSQMGQLLGNSPPDKKWANRLGMALKEAWRLQWTSKTGVRVYRDWVEEFSLSSAGALQQARELIREIEFHLKSSQDQMAALAEYDVAQIEQERQSVREIGERAVSLRSELQELLESAD